MHARPDALTRAARSARSPGINKYAHPFGLGVYHTGVEVYGTGTDLDRRALALRTPRRSRSHSRYALRASLVRQDTSGRSVDTTSLASPESMPCGRRHCRGRQASASAPTSSTTCTGQAIRSGRRAFRRKRWRTSFEIWVRVLPARSTRQGAPFILAHHRRVSREWAIRAQPTY